MSSDFAGGYSMPGAVTWDMDDLVANSGGAVTSSGADEYVVHEDIEIPSGSTLTVTPGETVYFDSATGFSVNGILSADGDDVNSVTFTSSAGSPGFGDWDGITFYNNGGNTTSTVDYVNLYYAEDGITVNNTSLTISNSDIQFNVWGVRVVSGNVQISDSTFGHNGILAHPDPYYSVGGGIYTDNMSTGFIEDNIFNGNIGGIRIAASYYFYIMNNQIYNNTVYGIYCEGGDDYWQGYTNIIGNDITINDNYGIYMNLGFESFIDGNNITFNRVGIHISGDPLEPWGTMGGSIHNNYIAFNTEIGIECYDTGGYPGGSPPNGGYPYISYNDFISNGDAGLYLERSTPWVDNNDFIDNYFGIYAYDSDFTVQNSYFDSNEYAVWANGSDVLVMNCQIYAKIRLDFYMQNDAYITALNTTFDDYGVYFEDGLSQLEVKWYLHVLVMNVSGFVPWADVTVSDNANGSWTQDFVGDAGGRVKWIEVTEYLRDLSSWVYFALHNISASKGAEVGYVEAHIDMSMYVVVDISPGPVPNPPLPPFDLDIILIPGSLADLELSWAASPDDGGGENDVVAYNIYRAVAVGGPFTYVDSVPATGAASYSWIDSGKGDGDWNNYFYIVRAEDSEGLEDDNEVKVGKFASYLVEGWNLVSVPMVQSDTALGTVLQTLGSNYFAVQGYHAGKSRPWLHWHRDKPNYFNDVISIDHKNGYYVDMETGDYLVTAGRVASTTDIALKSGWNLVGNPSLSLLTRDVALSSIAGKYNMVERFDTVTGKEVRLQSGDHMEPGLGYWIHATQDCTWTVTN
jgi:parallel beta-helix repeat protein